MTITNDAFGNYYIGNYVAGTSLDWTTVLNCLRQALGSDDRANLASSELSSARIDWRPNIPEETLTGVIPVSSESRLWTGNQAAFTLVSNSRISFSYAAQANGYASTLFLTGVDNLFQNAHTQLTPNNTDSFWMVANNRSLSYFIYKNENAYYFYTSGFLLNSGLAFPQNAYAFYISRNGDAFDPVIGGNAQSYEVHARGFTGSLRTLHTSTAKANYNHNRLSDGAATTAEVEFYLRDAATDIPYGYIPNVFKWKVDGTEEAVAIGSTVRLNVSNAIGYYAGQGSIFCKVVGRLGNTRNSFDPNGDYILMRTGG
jgi:hypothetical protein